MTTHPEIHVDVRQEHKLNPIEYYSISSMIEKKVTTSVDIVSILQTGCIVGMVVKHKRKSVSTQKIQSRAYQRDDAKMSVSTPTMKHYQS